MSTTHTSAQHKKGFTLVEMVVAIGVFALIMTLAAGAYLVLIAINRQAQAVSTSIDSLAFSLETMTRDIRTGSGYNCGTETGGNCSSPPGDTLYFTDNNGRLVSYGLIGGAIVKTIGGTTGGVITDPAITVSALRFYVSGTTRGDAFPPHVTIVITGSISAGPGKTQTFSIETGATMRGLDI